MSQDVPTNLTQYDVEMKDSSDNPDSQDLLATIIAKAIVIGDKITEKIEPVNELREFNQILDTTHSEVLALLCADLTGAKKKEFYSKVFKGVADKMLAETVCQKQEYMTQILSFFRNILVNYFPHDIANEDLAEIVHNIFTFEANLYSSALSGKRSPITHAQDQPELELSLEQKRILSESAWRSSLNVGDKLDCIKMKQVQNNRISHWARATIDSLHGPENESIGILFDNDHPSSSIIKIVKRDSPEIAPYLTYTDDFDWRYEMQQGDEIDCMDSESIWYRSTALDIRTVGEVKEAYVGFRVYHEEGHKSDDDGRKYTGWSTKYDEWRPVTEPTLQRFNTVCRNYKIAGKSTMIYDYNLPDDNGDVLYNNKERKIWAVYRTNGVFTNLKQIPDFLNEFGARGGFEHILSFFSTLKLYNKVTLKHIFYLMDFLSKSQTLWQRQFACYYVPEVQLAFEKALLYTNSQMSGPLQQKFSRENLTALHKAYQNILKRYYTTEHYQNILADLQFQIGFSLLNSEKLEQRISGLKEINEQVKNAKFTSMRRSISAKDIIKKLKEENVIGKLFGDNYHIQLIQRSSEIIKFLAQEREMGLEELDFLWSATKKDQQTKMEIYKIILDSAITFKADEIDFLVDKFSQVPPNEFVDKEIECVYELSKYCYKQTGFQTKSANLFWEIATLKRPYKKQIVEIAIEKFLELIRNWDRDPKAEFMKKCIDNISQHKASIQSIKILQKLLDQLPQYKQMNQPTLYDFTNTLIDEFKIFDILISDLEVYLTVANDLWAKKTINEENIEAYEMQDSPFSHRSNVFLRLNFIKQILQNAQQKLQLEHLDQIWALLMVKSQLSTDSDIFFNWFKQLLNEKKLSDDLMNHFFQTQVCQLNVNFKNLKKAGFECIQQLFLQVNELQDKMQVTQQYGGMVNGQSTTKLEFRIIVPPNELEGIEVIWRMLQDVDKKNNELTSLVIDLLTKIYHNVSINIESRIHEIEDQFVNECLKRLQAVIDSQDVQPDEKKQMTHMTYHMMKSFFEDSEKQGTGGLRTHQSIERGDYLTKIVIQNNITFQKNCPKMIVFNTYSNMTIWELKKMIALKTKTSPLQIQLNRGDSKKQDLKDQHNCKMLRELGIGNYEVIIAQKKAIVYTSRVPLLTKNKELVPEAKKIFESWFDMFSVDGFMTHETCVDFIKNSTKDNGVAVNDSRVVKLFDTYDSDNDGRITKEEFLHFYKERSIEKQDLVWTNLTAHHIGNNLKPISHGQYSDDDPDEIKDKTVLPRFKIANSQPHFDQLFLMVEKLDNAGQEELWSLISNLSTNPRVYMNILGLSGIDEIIAPDTSVFKQLYCLQIIYSLVQEYSIERKCEVESYYAEALPEYKSEYPSLSVTNENGDNISGPQDDGKNVNPPADSNFAIPLPAANTQIYSAKVGGNVPLPPPGGNSGVPFVGPVQSIDSKADKDKVIEQLENFKGHVTKEEINLNTFTDEDLVNFLPGNIDVSIQTMKKRWLPTFIGIGGFQLLLQLLTNINNHCLTKGTEDILQSKAEREGLNIIMKIMKILIMTSFSASAPDQDLIFQLHRKMSSIVEEQPKEPKDNNLSKEDDKMLEELFSSVSTKKKDVKKEQQDLAEEFQPLIQLFQGELSNVILEKLDFKAFQAQILSIMQLILKRKKNFMQSSFDRAIIDQSLSLWISCILYNSDLLQVIYDESSDEESNKETIAKILVEGGLMSDNQMIRESFKEAILFICQTVKSQTLSEHPVFYFLRLLIKDLDKLEGKHKLTKSYFKLLEDLLAKYFEIEKTQPFIFVKLIDVPSFLRQIISQLINYESKESKRFSIDGDSNLIGYLSVISALLKNSPGALDIQEYHELTAHIVERCLFTLEARPIEQHVTKDVDLQAVEKVFSNKCMNIVSREAAYQLLLTICEVKPELISEIMSKYWLSLISKIKKPKKSGYAPRTEGRTFAGYSGIKNLGCICYMNSMIQQFFHIPTFRYSLLAADDKQAEKLKELEGDQVDDNVLHQLMKCMAFLELSERQDYNPREFCFSFKDFDGQPTNVRIQQDAQEFLNLAFDRIENLLAKTSQKYLLQNVFGGKVCSLMICKSCGNLRQRQEDFYNLSLEVKNQKTIYEGLKKFTAGEIINDFQCEACGKRVDVERKTVLEKLPNILIVHLQRIVFDFETMMNAKLNSRVEFPNVLNLKSYMLSEIMKQEKEAFKKQKKERKHSQDVSNSQVRSNKMEDEKSDDQSSPQKQPSQSNLQADAQVSSSDEEDSDNEGAPTDINMEPESEESFEYKLVGVVVHMGVAEAGHYFSYINIGKNTKTEDQPEWLKTENDKWMEFNDSNVKHYNFKSMEEDCFGGAQSSTSVGASSDYKNDYSRNAYMLIYEKRVKEQIKIVIPEDIINQQVQSSSLGCESTAISRGIPNTDKPHILYTCPQIVDRLSSRQGIEYDSEKNEHFTLIDFNQIEKFVPQTLYKTVHEDNQVFLSEKQIFNNAFFKTTQAMIEMLINERPEYLASPEDSQQLFDFMERIIFDILAMTSENKQLGDITKLYLTMLSKNDTQVINLINKRILNFDPKNKGKDEKTFFDSLISNYDKDVRELSSNLLTFIVNRLFETHNTELLDKIMNIVFGLIPEEASKNWLKLHQFLQFLFNVTKSGQAQLKYMVQHSLITKLIDFFLENESPLQGSSKKQQMGSNYANPPFEPLILTVSYIARNMPSIPENFEQQEHIAVDQASSFYMKSYDDYHVILSHQDIRMLHLKQFYNKAIKFNYECAEVGRLCAHVAFENFSFSNKLAKRILVIINKANGDDIQPSLDVLEPFLSVHDSYKQHRIEWLFGIPQIKLERPAVYQMSQNQTNLKLGVSIMDNMNDEIYEYRSTLFKIQSNVKDSLLQILYQFRNRWYKYALLILQTVTNVANNDDDGFIYKYMRSIEPPTYSYSRYVDWIKPYLKERIDNGTNSSISSQKQELIIAVNVLSLFENLEKKFEDDLYFAREAEKVVNKDSILEHLVGPNDPEAYLIWGYQDETQIHQQDFEEYGITFTVKQIRVQATNSQPTGYKNLSIPSSQFSQKFGSGNNKQHGYNLRQNSGNQKRGTYARGMGLAGIANQNKPVKGSVLSRRAPGRRQKGKKTIVSGGNPQNQQDWQQAEADGQFSPQDAAALMEVDEEEQEQDDTDNTYPEQENEQDQDANGGPEDIGQAAVPINYEEAESYNNQQDASGIVPSINQSNGEDEAMQEDDHQWHFDDTPAVLVFSAYNSETKPHKVVLTITQRNGGIPVNFKIPVTSIPMQVMTKKEKEIAVFTKLRPFEEWGDYDFELRIEQHKGVKFNIQPQFSPNKEVDMFPQDVKMGPALPGNEFNTQFGGSGDMEVGGGTTDAAGGDIPCGACTYLNSSFLTSCEMCGSKLK